MDDRLDPIQVIARPGRSMLGDRDQVLGSWIHAARKVGWRVEPLEAVVDWPSGECGIVEIEGLRYLIRLGRRSRGMAIIVPDGDASHVAGLVAESVLNPAPTATRPVFVPTTWAEPILSDD